MVSHAAQKIRYERYPKDLCLLARSRTKIDFSGDTSDHKTFETRRQYKIDCKYKNTKAA